MTWVIRLEALQIKKTYEGESPTNKMSKDETRKKIIKYTKGSKKKISLKEWGWT